MEFNCSGKLTKEEYFAKLKLNNNPLSKTINFRFDLWVLLVIIGVLLLLLFVQSARNWNGSYWYLVELIGGMLLIILGIKFKNIISKNWEENTETMSTIAGRITDEFIDLSIPNGNLKVNWSDINGYGEYQDVFVLYTSANYSLPFLERFFEENDNWVSFKKYVEDNYPLSHKVNKISLMSEGRTIIYVIFVFIVIILLVYSLNGSGFFSLK